MTTIAYRDGVMAGDSGSWRGNVRHAGAVKVAKSPDGILVGASGAIGRCTAFLDAVRSSPRHEWPAPVADGDDSDFIALVVEDGEISVLTHYGYEPISLPYFAIGGGDEIAMGALYAGADAEKAVHAAVTHSQMAMLPVICVRAD